MRFHTQTAGVSLTAQQPEVNIVRTALEALSAVLGDVARLEGQLGSHDKQRLDQYLTSLRQLEQQIEELRAEGQRLAAPTT